MYGGFGGRNDVERGFEPSEIGGLEEIDRAPLKLGQDIRFLFVAVGGGGIRIGREFARKKPRYVETIAIHCEPGVQELPEFDRCVTLQAELGEEPDGPLGAGTLARAAEPALERIFDGAAFVAVVGSLGGTSGTGLFPSVVEAASRSAVVVSAFAVKPFVAEGERRGRAERALGRLHFLEAFVEKQQERRGHLQVLDNEALAQRTPKLPIRRLSAHWSELIRAFIEENYVRPAEAVVAAGRAAQAGELEPINPAPGEPRAPTPEGLPGVPGAPRVLPAALAQLPVAEVELRIEVEPAAPPDAGR